MGIKAKMKKFIEFLNDKIDMFVYELFFMRWRRKFMNKPELLIPFIDVMTEWANDTMSPERIEHCRKITKELERNEK